MRRTQLLGGSSAWGIPEDQHKQRKKQLSFLIKFIEMNPIQSNFTALQKIWSKQGGAHRAPKLWVASKLSCSLTELIFLPAFHTLQIFPLSFVTTKLFSQMEIVLMQMLSRNWTDSILCIPSELMHIQGPVPSFPDRSNSCSHTKMFDGTERGKNTGAD